VAPAVTVDDVRSYRTEALRTIEEVLSIVGSRSQASKSSPEQVQSVAFRLFLDSFHVLPRYQQRPSTVQYRNGTWAISRGKHSVLPLLCQYRPRPLTASTVILPVKSISASSSALGMCKRIAFYGRGASVAPGDLRLVHGARSLRLHLTDSVWDSGFTPRSRQLQQLCYFLMRNLCRLCLRLLSPLEPVSKSHVVLAVIRF
jgi:hypothetical protein